MIDSTWFLAHHCGKVTNNRYSNVMVGNLVTHITDALGIDTSDCTPIASFILIDYHVLHNMKVLSQFGAGYVVHCPHDT